MLKSVDLFTGAGGFTLGLQRAGFQCIGAVEADRFAATTFRWNFPDIPMFERDITSISDDEVAEKFPKADLVVGGPPCQGFSVAGPAQYGKIDSRNSLIFELLRFVKIIRPTICVLENVKGILSGKLSPERRAVDEYLRALEALGYTFKIYTLQTANFGVPQWRERVFIVGAEKQSHLPAEFVGGFGKGLKPLRNVRQALSDLPTLRAGEGKEDSVRYTKRISCEYQEQMRQGSSGVVNHVAMKHTPRLIERFKHIKQGESLVHVPQEHGQRQRNGMILDARMRFKMNNQRLHPSKISTAITASFQSNFIHPYQDRNLTAREGARLQSFPDSFTFCGPRTLMSKTLLQREGRVEEIGLSQYNQIGNAVPPLLAEAIARLLAERL